MVDRLHNFCGESVIRACIKIKGKEEGLIR